MLKRTAYVVLIGLIAACGTITVRKVPSPENYAGMADAAEWNKRQALADSMRGARYYLPRPYVLVKEELPIAGDGRFAQVKGVDGKWILVHKAPAGLEELLPDNKVGISALVGGEPHRAESEALQSEPSGKSAGADQAGSPEL